LSNVVKLGASLEDSSNVGVKEPLGDGIRVEVRVGVLIHVVHAMVAGPTLNAMHHRSCVDDRKNPLNCSGSFVRLVGPETVVPLGMEIVRVKVSE